MKIEISKNLLLTEIPSDFCREIMSRLTIENPAYADALKMGRWTGHLKKELRFFRKIGNSLSIPRGFTGQLISMAKRTGLSYQIEDHRRTLPEVNFTFAGQLKPFQEKAVEDMLLKDFGTLAAPAGSGKTVMACYMIAARRQPALVVVHTKELLEQWVERIGQFLDIPRDEIGIIGDGKNRLDDRITVGIINSIYPIAEEIREHVGHLVVDECHRTPSRTFTEAVTAFDCKYMLGLSATPYRRDGLSRLIFWSIGDVHHDVDKEALVENGYILRADVITRETNFTPYADPQEEYSRMLSELTEDGDRNRLIIGDIIKEASNGGGVCLVLSDRKEHCRTLHDMLSKQGMNADVLTGSVCNGERKAIVERLNAGTIRVLIATGQLIGEGFDAKSLQTLFLTTPIKFDGRLTQYLGRVLRPAPGKNTATVYDYLDKRVPVLAASHRARQRVYTRRCDICELKKQVRKLKTKDLTV